MGNTKSGRKTSISGEIILDYLSKYPQWFPSHSLAQLIYKENKNHFDDPEAVRTLVRYYRGKTGNVHRKQLRDKTFIEYTNRIYKILYKEYS